jgi:acylphosphatase
LALIFRAFRVTGKVQGVFFRHSTRVEAERLQLSGFARNLEDGSVEVFALGTPDALDSLQLWLQRGPARARVDGVEELSPGEQERAQLPAHFEVR